MLVKLVHFFIMEPQRPIGGLVLVVVGVVNYYLPNLPINIGKKYLKTAIIIDKSLIHAIVSSNYSTKPSYIFQFKPELKAWKYIF